MQCPDSTQGRNRRDPRLLKDRSRLKESTDRLKQALIELAQRKAQADQRVAEYKSMLARFKQLIDAGTLAVRIVEGRMVLVLPSDILFDSGSARLSKVGKAAVMEIGAVLASLSGRRVQVEGHTDNGRAGNRRIEIVLPPDLSMLPGVEELQQAIAQP